MIEIDIDTKTTKKLVTRFGELEFDLDKNISFNHGLIGFEKFKNFGITSFSKEGLDDFKILQSWDDENLSFIVTDYDKIKNLFEENYKDHFNIIFDIEKKDLTILYIVSVYQDKITINLKAPIIVDLKNNSAFQYVFNNDKYSIRYQIA